ncbi:hypothetical protein D3C80_1728960 [compost metagenome]
MVPVMSPRIRPSPTASLAVLPAPQVRIRLLGVMPVWGSCQALLLMLIGWLLRLV